MNLGFLLHSKAKLVSATLLGISNPPRALNSFLLKQLERKATFLKVYHHQSLHSIMARLSSFARSSSGPVTHTHPQPSPR